MPFSPKNVTSIGKLDIFSAPPGYRSDSSAPQSQFSSTCDQKDHYFYFTTQLFRDNLPSGPYVDSPVYEFGDEDTDFYVMHENSGRADGLQMGYALTTDLKCAITLNIDLRMETSSIYLLIGLMGSSCRHGHKFRLLGYLCFKPHDHLGRLKQGAQYLAMKKISLDKQTRYKKIHDLEFSKICDQSFDACNCEHLNTNNFFTRVNKMEFLTEETILNLRNPSELACLYHLSSKVASLEATLEEYARANQIGELVHDMPRFQASTTKQEALNIKIWGIQQTLVKLRALIEKERKASCFVELSLPKSYGYCAALKDRQVFKPPITDFEGYINDGELLIYLKKILARNNEYVKINGIEDTEMSKKIDKGWFLENIFETKHRILTYTNRFEDRAMHIKPDSNTKRLLATIMAMINRHPYTGGLSKPQLSSSLSSSLGINQMEKSGFFKEYAAGYSRFLANHPSTYMMGSVHMPDMTSGSSSSSGAAIPAGFTEVIEQKGRRASFSKTLSSRTEYQTPAKVGKLIRSTHQMSQMINRQSEAKYTAVPQLIGTNDPSLFPTQGPPILSEHIDLLWKNRYYLATNKVNFIPFIRVFCNEIQSEDHTKMNNLFNTWDPIDCDDALLCIAEFYHTPIVVSYAIGILMKTPDDELLLYLLQLAHAIKHELDNNETLNRNSLHKNIYDNNVVESMPEDFNQATKDGNTANLDLSLKRERKRRPRSRLQHFIIDRCLKSKKLANAFYWYVNVECREVTRHQKNYLKIREKFMAALQSGPCLEKRATHHHLLAQLHFFNDLLHLCESIKSKKETRQAKLKQLRDALVEKNAFITHFPLMNPLNTEIILTNIMVEDLYIFSSSMMPISISFTTAAPYGKPYKMIFKTGDDLRQDQLILQVLELMDRLLKQDQLDLKLCPYKVMALGPNYGLVEFVESQSIADVLNEHGSIQGYFRAHNKSRDTVYKISREVMDNYVKSCAGYSVITYLLGVGDRHLDNLMLMRDGRLFHIDFGFILGRDPKPFPPPMKLSREMVEGMGGMSSHDYQKFLGYSFSAFLILRKNANLILNLFLLAKDMNINDFKLAPDLVVEKVRVKFLLDLSEEEAIREFQNLINESVNALFPQVMEKIHKYIQYWRG